MVRPDDRAVDHLDRLAHALHVVQHVKQQIPEAGEGPPAKLTIHRRPLAEEIGQITPLRAGSGDPEDAVEDEPMIPRPATAVRSACRHKGLEEGLLLVTHQVSNQRRFPPKATLNHLPPQREILFVNTA